MSIFIVATSNSFHRTLMRAVFYQKTTQSVADIYIILLIIS